MKSLLVIFLATNQEILGLKHIPRSLSPFSTSSLCFLSPQKTFTAPPPQHLHARGPNGVPQGCPTLCQRFLPSRHLLLLLLFLVVLLSLMATNTIFLPTSRWTLRSCSPPHLSFLFVLCTNEGFEFKMVTT